MGALAYRDNWDSDPRTVELRERIEDLEFEISQQKLEHAEAGCLAPWGLELTAGNCRFMWALASAGGRAVTRESLARASAHDWNSDVDAKIADVRVYHCRNLVHHYGIDIRTEWGVGFSLSAKHAASWKRWCEASAQGEEPHDDFKIVRADRRRIIAPSITTEERARFRELWTSGVLLKEIALDMQRSVSTLSVLRRDLGLSPRGRGGLRK